MFLFEEFQKIPRLKREVTITEKMDGTNAQIAIFPIQSIEQLKSSLEDPLCLKIIHGEETGDSPLAVYAGSRTRWIKPGKTSDNFGFAQWVVENIDELRKLGAGRHYGEWYGRGIQRSYDLEGRRFALFNTARWNNNALRPACCDVVPVIATQDSDEAMQLLAESGSLAVPGWMNPEGIIVYHSASRQLYKRTFDQDGGKWRAA